MVSYGKWSSSLGQLAVKYSWSAQFTGVDRILKKLTDYSFFFSTNDSFVLST